MLKSAEHRDARRTCVSDIPLLIDTPEKGKPLLNLVLAPGAGALMDSPFMEEMARALAGESIQVIRFEFPYMQDFRKTGRRSAPDAPDVLQECWADVVDQIGSPSNLVIGGKSMGGRIASVVADRLGVRGLVCLGYPFHPAGRPAALRVVHLKDLKTPTLILQGTRDTLGTREEIAGYTLSKAIRVAYLEDGDHSFKPRKSSGRTYDQNMIEAVRETVQFCRSLLT
jgi:predicted alpha/beta-hydrolase family hydrolase